MNQSNYIRLIHVICKSKPNNTHDNQISKQIKRLKHLESAMSRTTNQEFSCSLCGVRRFDVDIDVAYTCTGCNQTNGMDCFERFQSDSAIDPTCDSCKCVLTLDLVYTRRGEPNVIETVDFSDSNPSRCYLCPMDRLRNIVQTDDICTTSRVTTGSDFSVKVDKIV